MLCLSIDLELASYMSDQFPCGFRNRCCFSNFALLRFGLQMNSEGLLDIIAVGTKRTCVHMLPQEFGINKEVPFFIVRKYPFRLRNNLFPGLICWQPVKSSRDPSSIQYTFSLSSVHVNHVYRNELYISFSFQMGQIESFAMKLQWQYTWITGHRFTMVHQ